MEVKILILEAHLLMWSARFLKYESWKANKVAAKHWPEAVLKDFREMDKLDVELKKKGKK